MTFFGMVRDVFLKDFYHLRARCHLRCANVEKPDSLSIYYNDKFLYGRESAPAITIIGRELDTTITSYLCIRYAAAK